MSWAEIKKAVNDNLDYPLNHQNKVFRQICITQSLTFTVPQTGTYLVTCVGHGGKGSHLPAFYSYVRASGASGAIAKSKLSLTQGQQIEVTVTSALSSFGNYLSATAGADGGGAAAPSGGTASGGNMINVNGIDGLATTYGGYGASTALTTPNATNWGSINSAYRGGAGYNPFTGAQSNGGDVLTGKAAVTTTPSKGQNGGGKSGYVSSPASGDPSVVVGGGGAGFGGGGGTGGGEALSVISPEGGAGAVMIEYFEEVFDI